MGKEAIINHENKTVEFFVLNDICGYGTTSQAYFEHVLTGIGNDYTVKIYINSYGGDVKEGIGISATLKRCPAKVIAYVDCFACSAASIMLLGADEIYIPKNASMMLHDGSWFVYGNPRELRKSADDLDVINEQVINSYALRTGDKLPKEKIRQIMANATWISAEQCVEYGLADGYTEYDTDIQKAAEQFKAAAQTGAAAYAKAPAQIAALLKKDEPPVETRETKAEYAAMESTSTAASAASSAASGAYDIYPVVREHVPAQMPEDTSKPQAGTPENNKSCLAEKLLDAMKKMEV